MDNRVKKVINRLDDNQKNLIKGLGLSVDRFVEDLLHEYIDEINDYESFDEEEYYRYVQMNLEGMDFFSEILNDEVENFVTSSVMKVRAFLSDKTEMFRELNVMTYLPFSELAYAVLASFNCTKGYDYKIKYKNKSFYRFDSSKTKSKDKLLAEEEFMADYNLVPGEYIKIEYDNRWFIKVKVLAIYENYEDIDNLPLLLKSNGLDILDGNRAAFNLLAEEKFDEIKKKYPNKKKYDQLMKYYNNKNPMTSQKEYLKRVDILRDKYSSDIDDLLDEVFLNDLINVFEYEKPIKENSSSNKKKQNKKF